MPRTASSEVAAKLVGAEIRRARLALGLSQVALATRLSVTAPYVAKVESGRANVTIGQLGNFAAALGTALEVKLPIVERAEVDVPQLPSLSTPPAA